MNFQKHRNKNKKGDRKGKDVKGCKKGKGYEIGIKSRSGFTTRGRGYERELRVLWESTRVREMV